NKRSRIEELLDAYTVNKISEPDFNELCQLVREKNDEELSAIFEKELRQSSFKQMDKQKLDRMLANILTKDTKANRVVRMFPWRKITAAAAVLLVIATGVYF